MNIKYNTCYSTNAWIRNLCVSILLISVFASYLNAAPLQPEQRLENNINRVLDIMYNADETESIQDKRDQVRAIMAEGFSFYAVIRRAFGKNWEKISDDDKNQIEHFLTEMIVNTYTRNLLGKERPLIEFTKTIHTSETKMEVITLVNYKGHTFTVIYHLGKFKVLGWQVYDILGEGVSIVSNYRKQLDEHFQNFGVFALINILEEKMEKMGHLE